MAWNIVVFLEEERVEVVPICWLINRSLCYWPNAKKQLIASLIKNCSVADKESWSIVKIRVLGGNKVYEDYAHASRAAEKACYKSDITSSEHETIGKLANSSKGRSIKRNKKFFPESDSSCNSDSSGSSLKSIPDTPKQAATKPDNYLDDSEVIQKKSQPISQKLSATHEKNDQKLQPTPQAAYEGETLTQLNKNQAVEETLQKLCSRVSYLTLLTKGAVNDIALIKSHLEATSTVISDVPQTEEVNQFPLETTQALEDFDQTLSSQENYLKIVKFMSRIGGDSPYDFVKRVMGRILTEELASQYSYTGHKGKKPFGDFFVAKALKDASRNVTKLVNTTELEMEKKMKDWLRHAPARNKKSKGENGENEIN